jgi:hypothetical protein
LDAGFDAWRSAYLGFVNKASLWKILRGSASVMAGESEPMGTQKDDPPAHLRPGSPVGVIYAAIGARFVREARLSAESVRRFLPSVPILLFTDQTIEARDGFDEVVRLSEPHPRAHINKLIAMMQSPFEKTLLLDTDTYVCAHISDIFALLDRFDIAMTQSRGSYQPEVYPPDSGVPDAFTELNQGVIAFRRSDAIRKALEEAFVWTGKLRAVSGTYPYDQAPMRIALFHSQVRLTPLPPEYNCRFEKYGCLNGPVRILHGRLPNGKMRQQDYERIANTLNRVTVPRVFIAGILFALSRKRLFGRLYWTRILVGHFYRPYIALFGHALAAFQSGVREEGLGRWSRRMAKRVLTGKRIDALPKKDIATP